MTELLYGPSGLELASLPNPFRDNVVADARPEHFADVRDIHRDVFDALLAGIRSVNHGEPDSLLVYGPAGSGKTHLLARLHRHLVETKQQAPDGVLHCVFIYVRLQTSPQLMWQHVRRILVQELMRKDDGITQLQRLVAHQVGERSRESPRRVVFRLRQLGRDDHDRMSEYLEQVRADLGLPRDLHIVLEHLVCNRRIRDASAWLAGESLPERAMAELGLGGNVPEDREEDARTIVTTLCRLAGATLPLVFCFDQLEALQRASDEREPFFRFGRMAADLFDADRNIFIVTCLQSALLETLKNAIRSSDRQRMVRREIFLETLSPAQTRSLVESRLNQVPEIAASRKVHGDNPLYPFPAGYLEELSLVTPAVPRKLLATCAHAFEELAHGRPLHHVGSGEFLDGELSSRQQTAIVQLRPGATQRVVVHGLQLLSGLVGVAQGSLGALRSAKVIENDPSADLILTGERDVAVTFQDDEDGRRLYRRLKHLSDKMPRPDGARTVIVRDPRLTISKTAVKTRELLTDLQARGAVVVNPSIEALAALDALRAILSDAKSGDLANDGEPIAENSVLGWLKKLREKDPRRLESIDAFLDAMLGADDAPPPDPLEEELAELVTRLHVVEVELAARELAKPASRISALARARAERFLVLEGPPTVLLDVAGVSATVEA